MKKTQGVPFTMQLRSAHKKRLHDQVKAKASSHKLRNGAPARLSDTVPDNLIPTTQDARHILGDVFHIPKDMDASRTPQRQASAQIWEDIFGGSLSSLSDSDEEDSGGELFGASSDEGTSSPGGGQNRSYRAPITPQIQNTFAGPGRADAPRNRRHPRHTIYNNVDDSSVAVSSPTGSRSNGPHRPLQRREAEIFTTHANSESYSTNSSFDGPSRSTFTSGSIFNPWNIFVRELKRLRNQHDLINEGVLAALEEMENVPDAEMSHGWADTAQAEVASVKRYGPHGTEIFDCDQC